MIGEIVFTTVEGAVTFDDVRAYLVAVRSDPAYRAGMSSLIDCRKVTTFLSPVELRAVATDVKRLSTSPARRRCAFVAASAAGFGLLRMYEVFSQDAPVDVSPFRDYDEALRWLNGCASAAATFE